MATRKSPALLAAKLKGIRTSLELQQEQLIVRLGCGREHNLYPGKISNYENDKAAPPLQVLLSYARLIGVSVDYLIDDSIPVSAITDAAEGLALEKVTTDEVSSQRNTDNEIPELDKHSQVFFCPQCNTAVQFSLQVKVRRIKAFTKGEDEDFTGDQIKLLEQFRGNGILSAFREAIQNAGGDVRIRNVERYILLWLARATPVDLPTRALMLLVNGYNTGVKHIEAYTYQYVTAVVSDKKIRCFIPTRLIKGTLLAAAKGSSLRLRSDSDQDELSKWVETRKGAGIAGGEFLRELQSHRNLGSFDSIK